MPQENQIEKIEQYHSGQMSPEETASFEKELASDPSLKAESDFQSEIINGIKEYRKTQLKSRLDAIDVSPGWVEFAQQSALVKSFGGIAIATAIGSGVYFLADSKSENPMMDEVENIEPIKEMYVTVHPEPQFEWTIPEALVFENSNTKEVIAPKNRKAVATDADPIQIDKSEQEIESSVKAVEATEEPFTPDFSVPDAGEISDNSDLSSSSLDEVPSFTSTENELKPIEVETKNTKSSRIKYRYYDGKLYLNGNFSKEPYEILEINSAKGRRIYLLHLSKYYEVKINDKLSELPEVTDVKLIRELRLIKENK